MKPTLVILPILRAAVDSEGNVWLTRKFIDGVNEYVKCWDGPVRVLMEKTHTQSHNLDNVKVDEFRSFGLTLTDFESYDFVGALGSMGRGGCVVLASLDHRQNHVPALCSLAGVPCVVAGEYTLKTRLQIARAETPNPVRLARRALWEVMQERKQRAAVKRATGFQSNGTPLYDAYAGAPPFTGITHNPLRYFDTRATAAIVEKGRQSLERRRARENAPIVLAYSGRLDAMKGVQSLVPLAGELRRRGFHDFRMVIAGDGVLRQSIAKQIEEQGLGDRVRLTGVLDYATDLVPMMTDHVDLFVCPHVQGDPSCTYTETLACGVPIVGWDNEAWRGMLRVARGCGLVVPMGDVRALASAVLEYANEPVLLKGASICAIDFARQNTLEKTFQRRADHLRDMLRAW